MKKKKEYAIYKGDEFVDLGTIEELAERLEVSKRTIVFYTTSTYKRRATGKGRRIAYLIEEDEEDGYERSDN